MQFGHFSAGFMSARLGNGPASDAHTLLVRVGAASLRPPAASQYSDSDSIRRGTCMGVARRSV